MVKPEKKMACFKEIMEDAVENESEVILGTRKPGKRLL